MTKKQLRKSRKCIRVTRFARTLVWIRLLVALIDFLVRGGLKIWTWLIAEHVTFMDASKVTELLKNGVNTLLPEPVSFFSLKAFGAFGSNYWYTLLKNSTIDARTVVWVSFFVGFLLVFFFFKRVSKSKYNVSAFFMLFLLSVVDAGMLFLAYGIPAYSADTLMIYISYGIALITILSCLFAMFSGAFLNRNYEKGMRLEGYNLRKIYRIQRKMPPIEQPYVEWNR